MFALNLLRLTITLYMIELLSERLKFTSSFSMINLLVFSWNLLIFENNLILVERKYWHRKWTLLVIVFKLGGEYYVFYINIKLKSMYHQKPYKRLEFGSSKCCIIFIFSAMWTKTSGSVVRYYDEWKAQIIINVCESSQVLLPYISYHKRRLLFLFFNPKISW
jgi:hypothetical protein